MKLKWNELGRKITRERERKKIRKDEGSTACVFSSGNAYINIITVLYIQINILIYNLSGCQDYDDCNAIFSLFGLLYLAVSL